MEELKNHEIEIHVENKQQLFCYMCPLKTDTQENLREHAKVEHGIDPVKCDKCEYVAEDINILKKHKMRHTGRILFTCRICEFEATKESIQR